MRACLIIATLVGLAPQAFADTFCDTLKTIIAAAPGQFADIRGLRGDFGRFHDPLKLPGALNYSADRMYYTEQACQVEEASYYFGPARYTCSFIASSLATEGAGEVEDMAMRVVDCLAVTPVGLHERPQQHAYTFVAHGVTINVSMGYHMHGGAVLGLSVVATS